jgi:hypothetical protein
VEGKLRAGRERAERGKASLARKACKREQAGKYGDIDGAVVGDWGEASFFTASKDIC